MTLIPTKWTTGDWIPRRGILGWHSADTAFAVTNAIDLPDIAGSVGTLYGAINNSPAVVPNVQNGYAALRFNGTTSRGSASLAGSFNIKHAFVVAGHNGEDFGSTYRGLLTTSSAAVTPNIILTGNTGNSTTFFDYAWVGDYQFRRFGVPFAANASPGSFNGEIGVFEVSRTGGMLLDSIQIGMDRNFFDRVWDGDWFEQILFDRVLSENEVRMVYEYFAMKYNLWKRDATDLDIFPFQPNWARGLTGDKVVLASRSVSGATKARSKSAAKKSFEASFEDRLVEEYDAAYAFWDQKYPGTSFIYRDDAFSPARDTEVLFTSPFPQQQAGYNQINYALQFLEV